MIVTILAVAGLKKVSRMHEQPSAVFNDSNDHWAVWQHKSAGC